MAVQSVYHLELLTNSASAPALIKVERAEPAADAFRFEVWPTEHRLITQGFGANPAK
jgi:hypothetical protein